MVIMTGSAIPDGNACWRLLPTVEVDRLCFTESAMPVCPQHFCPVWCPAAISVVRLDVSAPAPLGFVMERAVIDAWSLRHGCVGG